MSDLQTILSTIKSSVDRLGGAAASKQDILFRQLLSLTKKLETKGDNLLNNINNFKNINEIKIALEKLIIDDKYKSEVKAFAESFNAIQDLNTQYFSQFAATYRPVKVLNILKKTAIDSTLNGLTENGLSVGVIDGLSKVLQTNVNAGGSYADLTNQLRKYMLDQADGKGALEQYVRTYANTAINQFAAEYHKSVADDLGLEWYMYDGSLLETSREFCQLCVKKKYIHVSEFPALLRGDFGPLGKIKISKSTGLPSGLMAGTDITNLVRRRGGWNCGHQMIAVDSSVVPQAVKDIVYASTEYKNWGIAKGVKIQSPENVVSDIAKGTIQKNSTKLKGLESKGYNTHKDLFSKLGEEIAIDTSRRQEAYYNPNTKTIMIGNLGSRLNSPYFKETLIAHELGHAIHNTNNIIHKGYVNDSFRSHFDELRSIINGKEAEISKAIFAKRFELTTINDAEHLTTIADILGSLTGGKYGFGHDKRYYQTAGKSEAEIFAHGVSLMKVANNYSSITEEMQQVINKMIQYSKGL